MTAIDAGLRRIAGRDPVGFAADDVDDDFDEDDFEDDEDESDEAEDEEEGEDEEETWQVGASRAPLGETP